MIPRTWPYGTVKMATVKGVEVSGKWAALLLKADDDPPDEAHMILYHDQMPDVTNGDRGTMTFVEGGPSGGHWIFEPLPKIEIRVPGE